MLFRMTLTTHAVVGAAAASFFPEHPYLAFAAGFASHFAIDALPHWDYEEYLRSFSQKHSEPLSADMRMGNDFHRDLAIIASDALLGFVLTFVAAWVLKISPEIALIGAGAGIYPDLLQFVYFKIRKTTLEPMLHDLQTFHVWLQKGKEHPEWGWRKGLSLQALLVGTIVAILFVFCTKGAKFLPLCRFLFLP